MATNLHTTNLSQDEQRANALLELEGAVYDVALMCAIANRLCHEEFGDLTGDKSTDDDRAAALFTVTQALQLAEKLRADFGKASEVPPAD